MAFRLPAPADGVVWLSAADRPYADLLEKVFDAFYQTQRPIKLPANHLLHHLGHVNACLLYTSDAADERSSVDLGGRRIIKKTKTTQKKKKTKQ